MKVIFNHCKFSSAVFLLLIITIILNSCSSKSDKGNANELEGRISVSGAFALYPLVVKWGQEFQKLHPNVKIDISAGGAGKGIADALHDNVNLGMVSRDVRIEEIEKGAYGITVARDAVLPTISSKNPYLKTILSKGVSKEMFYKLWITGEVTTWGELIGDHSKDKINKYKRSDASGAGETWAKFLGKNQDELKGIGVFGDPGLAHAVTKDVFGIGFNNIAYVYDLKTQLPAEGLFVIPIDLNNDGKIDSTENFYDKRESLIKAISSKKYPSPPGRELYFISHGPPKDKLVIAFFSWILTDGQKYVPEMGYLPLSTLTVDAELEMLKANIPKDE